MSWNSRLSQRASRPVRRRSRRNRPADRLGVHHRRLLCELLEDRRLLTPVLTVNQTSVVTGVGLAVSNTGTWSDVSGSPANVTLTASVGTVTKNANGTWTWSYTPTNGVGQPSTVTITAEDTPILDGRDGERRASAFAWLFAEPD